MRLFKRTEPKELPSLATATNLFSPAECARIIEIGSRQTQYTGKLMRPAAGAPTETKRKSNVGWIHPGPESDFVFDRLERIATEVNQNTFQFSLMGFGEPLQFTTYSGGGSHYGWHQDIGGGATRYRKLSIVVQLSDPATYRGGNLEISVGGKPMATEKARGTGLIFAAWQLHRVTALEEGLRHSLVAWITGEPFR
jgi:PKHD-type hydroxylase